MNLNTKALMRLVFRQQQEDRVLCHEGLWQPCPSEAIVHVVKDTFLSTSEVIELHNLAVG